MSNAQEVMEECKVVIGEAKTMRPVVKGLFLEASACLQRGEFDQGRQILEALLRALSRCSELTAWLERQVGEDLDKVNIGNESVVELQDRCLASLERLEKAVKEWDTVRVADLLATEMPQVYDRQSQLMTRLIDTVQK